MKTQIKFKYHFLLAIFLFSANILVAQPPDEEQMARFKELKIQYFNENLALSESEAELFWPIYNDEQNRKMKINDDERNLVSYYNSNYEAMSEVEIDESIAHFMELQKKRYELTSQYHKKYIEVLGKRKTMKMYSIEREFKMHILRRFRGGEDRETGRRGHMNGPNRHN